MKVISFTEDDKIIAKILRHLGLWETRNHDSPSQNTQIIPIPELIYADSYSQLPLID